jgi:hypothetical protein
MDGDRISYSCFNCSFKASYSIGRPIYPKFEKFLTWLGVDKTTISKMKLETNRMENNEVSIPIQKPKNIDLPSNCSLIDYSDIKYVEYLKKRRIELETFSFLKSDDIIYKNRIIVPFLKNDSLVGYSARSLNENDKTRFLMKLVDDFVFGINFVEYDHKFVIVTEGLFDALSVKGLAVLHNEISDRQAEIIHDLHKKVIVVPDYDTTGLNIKDGSLISTAIDYGWNVAFPDWKYKDINEAYVDCGPLFVLKSILTSSSDDPVMIKVNQKIFSDRFKKKG